jgi:hypothetical protein
VLLIAAGAAATAATGVAALVAVDAGGRDRGGAPDRTGGPASTPPLPLDARAVAVLKGAAAYERRHEQVVAPRDDQFIYTREIVKETERKTGATRSYTDEGWRSVDGSERSWISQLGHGRWEEPQKDDGGYRWPPRDWPGLRKLPADPEKLLLFVDFGRHRSKSVGGIPDDAWWDLHFHLAGLLKLVPVMPQGLRSAAYEALAMIPGVKAIPGVLDAKGRVGVAITYSDPVPGDRESDGYDPFVIIFDPKTYALLGFRDHRFSHDGDKTYTQLSYLDRRAVVDHAKQRP